jgi:hypothetical protein
MKKKVVVAVGRLTVGVLVSLSVLATLNFSASAQVILSLMTDKDAYCLGEPVEISITATNAGNQSVTLLFPNTRRADFRIRDDQNTAIYLWSQGRGFLDMITAVTIEPGSTEELLSSTWEQIDQDGCPIPTGVYSIEGWLVAGLGHMPVYAPRQQMTIINCPIEGTKGDVDGDGVVSVTDAICAVNFLLRDCCRTTQAPKCWAADCHEDDIINILDVLAIVNIILGPGHHSPTTRGTVITPEAMVILTSLVALLSADDFAQLMALVKDVSMVPIEYSLEQNHPNPFNPTTTIHYTIPSREHRAQSGGTGGDSQLYALRTTLNIYNILGQEVRTLVDEVQEPGYYTATWDGRDNHGRQAVSGVYFYRLTSGEFTATRRMVLMK